MASAPVDHLVVVRDGRAGERPERRRRHCLERLSYELAQLTVTEMILESRGPAADKRDRDLLDALRARRVVPGTLRLEHVPGPADPMLWLPDAVCGAITRARSGDTTFTAMMRSRITVITLDAAH